MKVFKTITPFKNGLLENNNLNETYEVNAVTIE
jgi:hypothetical protein